MKVREARDLVEQITGVCIKLEKKYGEVSDDVDFLLDAVAYLRDYRKLIEQAINEAEISI